MIFNVAGNSLDAEECNDREFCCSSGVLGDQECQGRCISLYWVNDGRDNCDNGADEGVTGNFVSFYKKLVF